MLSISGTHRIPTVLFLTLLAACSGQSGQDAAQPPPMEVPVATVLEREISEWD